MTRARIALLAALLAGCGQGTCGDPEPGQICLVAGTGELGYNRDGLPPPETDFYLLSAVRRGPDGRVYLMDFNNQRLRFIDEEGLVQSVAGSGFHALANPMVPALDSPLENPIDFTFMPDGQLVFTSYHDPRVILVTDDGGLEVLAGAGEVGVDGDEGDGGPPLEALFIQLDGIAVDGDGVIYVSDSLAHRVRRITPDEVITVAGTGEEAYTGDGGPGTEAALQWPTALELDGEGNLLIADTQNHVIRSLAPDGTITTIAGKGSRGFSGDGGPATEAELDQPNGLAVAEDGTIYVADRGNFRIRRIAPDGTIDTIAGDGVEGVEGDGGDARDAELGFVARIALDGDSLLVADQSNSRARRVFLP